MVKVGNIIKINMYAELKRKKNDQLKLKTVEETILDYNDWIKKTNKIKCLRTSNLYGTTGVRQNNLS